MRKKIKVPPFLEVCRSGMKDSAFAASVGILRNWKTVYEEIRNMKPNLNNVEIVKRLMVAEYYRDGGKPRMDIIVRLHMRMNRLRQGVERAEL